MKPFYDRLSYSFGNEDWVTERDALGIEPNDQVLCVTASGDRPLNLLASPCKRIVSIDANPMQTACFDLKKAALVTLDYDEYLAFLGLSQKKNRLETFETKLKKYIKPESLPCLQLLRKEIKNGIIYQGVVEKTLRVASRVIRFMKSSSVDKLFGFDNLKDQMDHVNLSWKKPIVNLVFKVLLHPTFTRHVIKDPGLYENVDENIHVGNHLYERFLWSLQNFPAKENILLSLLLKGKIFEESYPPYLDQEKSKLIRDRIDCINTQTIDLHSYLREARTKGEKFDCFSLSDVASYLTLDQFNELMELVYACANDGARFSIRQFLSNYKIPEHLAPHFNRNRTLEEKLKEQDRCFIYTFTTGTITKS